jgi:hypothetical protein
MRALGRPRPRTCTSKTYTPVAFSHSLKFFPVNSLANLGMMGVATQQPHAHVGGLSLAPPPRNPSLRRNIPKRNHQPATNPVSDASRQMADADIRGMIGALAQLDHFARRLQDHCPMKYDMKRQLSLLVNQCDNLLGFIYKDFTSPEADDVNAWANLIGQAAGLILQLTPPQAEASLKHMHNMSQSVLAYIPPTLPAECIEHTPS